MFHTFPLQISVIHAFRRQMEKATLPDRQKETIIPVTPAGNGKVYLRQEGFPGHKLPVRCIFMLARNLVD